MFKLQDGTTVSINGVIFDDIYGGMLEGVPDKELNQRILDRQLTQFQKLWGGRKAYLVDPTRRPVKHLGGSLPPHLQDRYKNAERLPDVAISVWLSSWWAPSDEDDGTLLVLIFLVDKKEAYNTPLQDLIISYSAGLDWKTVAQGFGV